MIMKCSTVLNAPVSLDPGKSNAAVDTKAYLLPWCKSIFEKHYKEIALESTRNPNVVSVNETSGYREKYPRCIVTAVVLRFQMSRLSHRLLLFYFAPL